MRPAGPAGWSKITRSCSTGGPGPPWVPSPRMGEGIGDFPCPFRRARARRASLFQTCPRCGLNPAYPHIPHILPQWPGLHGNPRRAPVIAAQFTDPSRELNREVHWPVRYA
eukprot:18726-Chlamydomonas_euryale.AAC.2